MRTGVPGTVEHGRAEDGGVGEDLPQHLLTFALLHARSGQEPSDPRERSGAQRYLGASERGRRVHIGAGGRHLNEALHASLLGGLWCGGDGEMMRRCNKRWGGVWRTSAMVRVASGWTSSKVKLRVSQRLPKRLMTTLLYCTALQYRTHATAVAGEKSRHDEREVYVLATREGSSTFERFPCREDQTTRGRFGRGHPLPSDGGRRSPRLGRARSLGNRSYLIIAKASEREGCMAAIVAPPRGGRSPKQNRGHKMYPACSPRSDRGSPCSRKQSRRRRSLTTDRPADLHGAHARRQPPPRTGSPDQEEIRGLI